jgi:hypothetical protein
VFLGSAGRRRGADLALAFSGMSAVEGDLIHPWARCGRQRRREGTFTGVAGVLALTSAKSGALVGVLISVTTGPAAANAAVALAYRWWPGSLLSRPRAKSVSSVRN